MKFFHYNKEDKTRYLVEWSNGYILFSSDWEQIRYRRFNWITFALIEFELERELGSGITIRLGLVGFRLMLYWLWKESKLMKQLAKAAKDYKKGKVKGIPFEEFKKKLK